MCDTATRSMSPRTNHGPHWRTLYVGVVLMLAAIGAVDATGTAGRTKAIVECGLVMGEIGTMAFWTRRNRAPLDLEQWCECAAATVTIRVIPSCHAVGPPAHAVEPVAEEQLQEVTS
jgi:hypothetical protein